MKDVLEKNKYRLKIIASMILLLAASLVVGKVFRSLKFFELIPLATFLGIGFMSFFRKVFPVKNIVSFLISSFFLGIWGNTLIIFVLGAAGMAINTALFIFYIPICLVLNLILFFIYTSENDIKGYVMDTKLEIMDFVWLTIFLVLLGLFVNICLEAYFPLWDSFTYWALDAKYIFEHSYFRDGSFVLLANNYLPFYTLQIDFVYLLYNEIVEQSASLLSVTYVFMGIFFIWSYLIDIKNNDLKKCLLNLCSLGVLCAFFSIHYLLLSMYADAFTSVVTLFYAAIIFYGDFEKKDLWKRSLILILLASTLYLTKTHFLIFSLCLLLFYVAYDFNLWKKEFKNINENKKVFSILVILLIFFLIVARYSSEISNESGFVQSVVNKVSFSSDIIISNIRNIFIELFSRITIWISTVLTLGVCTFFIRTKLNRKDLWKLAFVLLLTVFPFGLYIFGVYPLSDSSLLRYLGLTYFVVPWLFIDSFPFVDIKDIWQKRVFTFLVLCVPLFFISQISMRTGFDFKFTPTSGSYKDYEFIDKSGINKDFMTQKGIYKISQKIEEIVPDEKSLLVISHVISTNVLTDGYPSAFFLRYYLLDHSKTDSYSCEPEMCYKTFDQIKPDYLVVYWYDGYWSECKNVLMKDGTYLIKLDWNKNIAKQGNCLASEGNITKLE